MSRAPGAVWFQRAYSGNPICSPTRASVLTGRTPARTCIYNVDHHILCVEGHGGTNTDSTPCKRGEYSIANATREKNYMSGVFGKVCSCTCRVIGSHGPLPIAMVPCP
jgi:arylsulfatase A-like enzyme